MSDVFTYDPTNWFWHVAENDQVWSSLAGGYVGEADAERLTRIASEAELTDVLEPYGLPTPRPGPVAAWRLQAGIDVLGLRDKLTSALATLPSETAAVIGARLKYAPTIARFDPLIDALGDAMALSSSELDDLWWKAAAF